MNTFKNETDFRQFNQRTKNSKRTKIVTECLKKASNPKKKQRKGNAGKREMFKNVKLQKLDKSVSTKLCEQKVDDIKRSFDQKKNVFFSGKVSAHIGTHKEGDGIVLSAQKDCVVVDDEGHFNGIVGYDKGGNVVFVKIPRKHAIDHNNTPIVGKYVGGLKELLKNGDKGRGVSRQVRSDGYTFDGTAASYCQKGLHLPKNICTVTEQMMKRVGKITNEYLPASFNRGLKEARRKVPHLNEFSTGLFSAIATGLNAYLCQHVDEDSFWSTTFIHCDDTKMLEWNQKYKLNLPVACYFVFGKLGRAVALRPGDILIFHPCVTHSNSSRTDFFEDNKIDIYCSSMYLKTRVVGGNNADGKVEFIKRVK